jgi:hypothetical protein
VSYGVMTRRGFVGVTPIRRRYRAVPHRRGMGTLNYYDLLAQANLQNCDPRDSACVADNVAKEAAVEDLWVSRYMVTGAPDDTQLSFAPLTTQQVTAFASPGSANVGNVVPTGIMQVNQPATYVSSDPVPQPPVTPPKTPAPGTPGGAKVINSSGVSQPASEAIASAQSFLVSTVGGFPAWAWLLGGGFALYAFGGGRGR